MAFDRTRLRGSLTALVTPFAGGKVDEAAFKRVVAHQLAGGTDGLVPCGTTGESPTLSHEEHRRVLELTVAASNGKAFVLGGAGSNATSEAIELAQHAEKVGCDAAMCVVPYYNKPSQEGLYRHFATIAETISIPLVLYNVPGRTVVDLMPETIGRLAKIANIIGIKDATGRIERVTSQRLAAGADFIQLSGEDASAIGFNAHGGVGCISVTSNAAPELCAKMQAASLAGDLQAANVINDKLMALHDAMFCEPSPAPAKYACSLLGLCGDEARLPVGPLSDAGKARVKAAMTTAGLL
ncbi:MAG: 4-hydroxy-tetrahydrodipicolinate synthase [Alphaproteobacteria bacterium]|nr:4-hydroxy-tetrahydrodipicolinate synthase [Alphaproteobacteria bacterium]